MKTELKNLQYCSHTVALSESTIVKKCRFFAKKILASVRLRGPWY